MRIKWLLPGIQFASVKQAAMLPSRVKKHQSVLIRKLGVTDMQLQYNKVTNIKIAVQHINNLVIKPGETFSFCKLVGLPTKKKGYLTGMELSFGEARPGTGGGICQIANLINWLVMHSPLQITKRSHHSYDPFPDEGRVLPFGSGAAVFYNYIDYQFINNTPHTFQLNLWLTDKCLEGELRINEELPYVYHVFEKNHRFIKHQKQFYRQNEIWRNKCLKYKSGEVIAEELLAKNLALVKYLPASFEIIESLLDG